MAFAKSLWSKTVFIDGVAAACFGFWTKHGTPKTCTAWLLATTKFEELPVTYMLRESRRLFRGLLDSFDRVEATVMMEKAGVLRWLQWCGFHSSLPEPYGIEQQPFVRCWLEKQDVS